MTSPMRSKTNPPASSCLIKSDLFTQYYPSLSGSTIYLANKQTQMVGRNYLDDVRKALLRIAQ